MTAQYNYVVKLLLSMSVGMGLWFWVMVLNATFNNISTISWRSVLVVEEAGVSECTLFCNLQSQARTHAVLVVIGLYELLGHPTT